MREVEFIVSIRFPTQYIFFFYKILCRKKAISSLGSFLLRPLSEGGIVLGSPSLEVSDVRSVCTVSCKSLIFYLLVREVYDQGVCWNSISNAELGYEIRTLLLMIILNFNSEPDLNDEFNSVSTDSPSPILFPISQGITERLNKKLLPFLLSVSLFIVFFFANGPLLFSQLISN